jgi:hypothetical protein
MALRIPHGICLALALVAARPGYAVAQGYLGYPDTIMVPEHGTVRHHAERGTAAVAPLHAHASLLGHEQFVGKLHRRPGVFVATRGSSGVVLPTLLPRTALIPPEGGGRLLTLPPAVQEQGPSIVPGVRNPVPNLPHGPETYQDRASRCAFQSGLYNVPGTARSQYMGGCVQ